jgi:hypothetical protein
MEQGRATSTKLSSRPLLATAPSQAVTAIEDFASPPSADANNENNSIKHEQRKMNGY